MKVCCQTLVYVSFFLMYTWLYNFSNNISGQGFLSTCVEVCVQNYKLFFIVFLSLLLEYFHIFPYFNNQNNTLLPEGPRVQRNEECLKGLWISGLYILYISSQGKFQKRSYSWNGDWWSFERKNKRLFYFLTALIMRSLYITFSQNNCNNIIQLDYEAIFTYIKLTEAAPSLSVLIFYVAG